MSISELYRTSGVIAPVESPSIGGAERKPGSTGKPDGISDFEKIFRNHQGLDKPATDLPVAKEPLKFSSHAETRIKSRSIPWNEDLERRVNSGIDSAKEKGSRETLILADNVAVIANVKSRTVITAMDSQQLKERIFTNIDSAVIV